MAALAGGAAKTAEAAEAAAPGTPAGHRRALLHVHQIRVDLIQKAGGRIALGAPEDHPALAGRKIQLLLCTGDAHVAQAALLLQLLVREAAHIAGEDAFLHAHDEHIVVFQTLCGVHGHHDHHVVFLVVAVQVRNQGHFFQKACQSGFLALLVRVGFHAGNQLAKVFQPGRAFVALGFQHLFVAGDLQKAAHKLIQRQGLAGLDQLQIDAVEAVQRAGRPADGRVILGVFAHAQQINPQPGSDVAHFIHGGSADLAGGLIDDAL